MRTWETDARPIDRGRGEGPAPCCAVAIVAADALTFVGSLPIPTLSALRASRPDWQGIPDTELWLCGACLERALRHKVLTREDWARGHGLAEHLIAGAWLHDEEFWHRGPLSAPAEVKAQSWWRDYQTLALNTPRGQMPGAVQALLRNGKLPT